MNLAIGTFLEIGIALVVFIVVVLYSIALTSSGFGSTKNNVSKIELSAHQLYSRESFIFNTIEGVLVALDDQDISKAEIAESLGYAEASIQLFLEGTKEMPLPLLADICYLLNLKPQVIFHTKEGYKL